MPKIKKLTEVLANKIAAGEVVERPASAVKELCENSIDAKSERIIVEIEKGGKTLVRVSDDGCGMSREDAVLAVERYATSKIYNDDDLFSIKTLGFRGEALPSIASVSKFTLITREQTDKFGTKIIIEGGVIKDIIETGAPVGTTIEIKDLFSNIPARRKFLKTTETETGHIADIIRSFALGFYDISFLLIHNGKEIKNFPSVSSPSERVKDILNIADENDLYEIIPDGPDISVKGWIVSPDYYKSTSKGIYLFVNGRFVRDRKVNYALFEGFKGRLMKGNFPIAVIFIDVPSDQVDVNVHPVKQEVRFLRERDVMNAVSMAVGGALKRGERIIKNVPDIKSREDTFISGGGSSSEDRIPEKSFTDQPLSYSPKDYVRDDIYENDYIDRQNSFYEEAGQYEKSEPKNIIPDEERTSDIRVIGQFLKTYIVCEEDNQFLLIDQHAAHERILFEKLKQSGASSATASQRLLIPEVFESGYAEAEIIGDLIPDMERIGIELEPFGENTFAIKAIPAFLAEKEIAPVIIDIAEKLIQKGGGKEIEKRLESALITIACHGAVRANHELSEKEMKSLLRELAECEIPSRCPHGRPTSIRMTQKEIEKLFKRIT